MQPFRNITQPIKLTWAKPFISTACDLLHGLFLWEFAGEDRQGALVKSLMAASRSPSSGSELGHCEVPLSLFLNLNGHYSCIVSLAALTEMVLCCICFWAWEWKIQWLQDVIRVHPSEGYEGIPHILYKDETDPMTTMLLDVRMREFFIIRSSVEEAASTFLHPSKPKIMAIVNLTH